MVTRERARSGGLDGIEIAFDDGALVADAGLVLPATLRDRLGAQELLEERVRRPNDRRGAGARALSVVFAMLAGADCIDDIERLRAGSSGAVLGLEPRAVTTVGTPRGDARPPRSPHRPHQHPWHRPGMDPWLLRGQPAQHDHHRPPPGLRGDAHQHRTAQGPQHQTPQRRPLAGD